MNAQRVLPPASSSAEYLALFEDCFPEVRGTLLDTREHYCWKYGPAGKQAAVFESGAFEDRRMVGYYAALPFQHRIGPARMPGGLVCDVMTHSSMRGRGMFTSQGRFATSEMARSGIAFCTGFPIRPEVIPGHLKVGWSIAFPLPVFVRLLDPREPLRSRGAGWLNPLIRPLAGAYQAGCRLTRPRRSGSVKCEPVSIDALLSGDEFAAFHDRWISHYTNCLERSPPFLRWRLAAPGSSYTILALRMEGRLAGVAIMRETKLSKFRMTAIVDLMIPPESRLAASALHDAMAQVSRQSGTAGLAIMCSVPDAGRFSLYRNGFWKMPVVFKLILKWLREEPAPAHFFSAPDWHLTWLDTDNL